MTSFLPLQSQSLILSPFNTPTKPCNPFSTRQTNFNFFNPKPPLRHSIGVIRFSFKSPSSLPDLDGADGFIQALFSRTESVLYTLADAAVSASTSGDGGNDNGDWFTGITNLMETVLKILKDGLSTLHVPYSYGFAIILLTVIVKAATFPLTKKQVESAMAMRSLQPQLKAIQQQYANDKERIQLETARLYKLAGINPLAGCLPTVATIPVWIGLYRALSNVANEGLLTEGFFWIPSLAGPTTVAARQNGSGVSWLFPFVDGHPPLGWSDTLAYLVLPLLLIFSQYISVQIMQSSQSDDPNMKTSQALTKVLPLMIGYFALSVPSGLSLYWLTNNILSTAQQIWLQKLGGAKNPVSKFTDDSIKEVQQKLQETVANVNSTNVVESKKEENLSGPRPGDRFKQLKEQEARKRQQREEEKKKLAGKGSEIMNKEEKGELKSVKAEDEITEAVSADVQEERVHAVSNKHDSAPGATYVNGELSIQLSNENQNKISVPRAESGGLNNTGVDGKQDLSHEHVEKNDATERYTATTPSGGLGSSENAQPEETGQQRKRDEI